MDYAPDGKSDELFGLLQRFGLFEVTTNNYIFGNAPGHWQSQIQDAERAKQRGEYLRSAEDITVLMQDADTAYTQLIDMLFEIEVCAGFITMGTQRLCYMIQKLEMAELPDLTPVYKNRLKKLAESFTSEESLRAHLSVLCGNTDYYLPDDYLELKAQFDDMKEGDLYGGFFDGLENGDGSLASRWPTDPNERASRSETPVPLTGNDDGSFTFTAHESMPFTPDLKWEEIEQLVTGLIHDSDEITGRKLLRRSAESYPEAWEPKVRQAVDLKRRGQFLASARIYDDLSRSSGVLYTGIIAALYKSVAASGALLSGNFLLMNGSRIFHQDPKAVAVAAGSPSNFEAHLSRLIDATRSQPSLEAYLRDICGNVNYWLPRDYAAAVGELTEHYAAVKERWDALERKGRSSGAGCYVATAVYGSHDAPPVLTLRRFRDQKLAETSAGRVFIRVYYAISPSIAKRLENAATLNTAVKRVLDFAVKKLDARGYSGTEY